MANADERRRFATDRFLKEGIGRPPIKEITTLWERYRLVEKAGFSGVPDHVASFEQGGRQKFLLNPNRT